MRAASYLVWTRPFDIAQHVALLADGPEILGQQRIQRVSIGADFGLVEGTLKPVDVGDHEEILPDRVFEWKPIPRRPIGAHDPVAAGQPLIGTIRVIAGLRPAIGAD